MCLVKQQRYIQRQNLLNNNKASVGGAVKLGQQIPWWPTAANTTLTFAAGSNSCWIGNIAHNASGGGAMHIDSGSSITELSSSVNFLLSGKKQQHNFGSNRAGAAGHVMENDIQVAGAARFTCGGGKVRRAGGYVITGDVCAAACTGNVCRCKPGQAFAASKCSCQPTL